MRPVAARRFLEKCLKAMRRARASGNFSILARTRRGSKPRATSSIRHREIDESELHEHEQAQTEVGHLMVSAKALVRMIVLLFALLPFGHVASAQSSDERGSADRILLFVVEVAKLVTSAYVAGNGCHVGDPERWMRVVDTIDERYERCVVPGSVLALAVEREFAPELRFFPKKAIGSLAFERFLPNVAKQFEDSGRATCADPGLKTFVDTGIDTGKARYRDYWVDGELVFKISDDRRWRDAPCDQFFPEGK